MTDATMRRDPTVTPAVPDPAEPRPEGPDRLLGSSSTPSSGEAATGERAERSARTERSEPQHVAIVTGLSGAGKTAMSKLFEDLGYSVVDNVPAELLSHLAELIAAQPRRFARVAVVLDVRAGDVPAAFAAAKSALEARGIEPQVFFLEARDEVLIRRFSETRHRHPLDELQRGVAASITKERILLDPVRDQADVIIDTSDLSGRQLRERIFSALESDVAPDEISLQLISFGYKYGVPLEADLVFDVRFLENPFYIDDLRPLSGLTEPVREFVLGQPLTQRFLEFADEFFAFTIPAYQAEGKTRLTVAIGCTGGYHRSIAIAEALARTWREHHEGPVRVWHRELERA